MNPLLIALATSMAQAQQRKRAEQQARQGAQVQLSQRRAAEHGYPTYGIQAGQLDQQLRRDDEQQNPLAALLPMLMRGQGGGGG